MTFKAADANQYLIYVIDQSNGSQLIKALVKPGESLTVLCPNDTSQVKFAAGKNWRSDQLFGPDTVYFALDHKTFSSDADKSGVTVELRSDGGGAFRWRRIQSAEFQ